MRVIELNGIKIAAPLTRFKVGATVPCWVTGIPDQISPLILGTINNYPPIEFHWGLDDSNIAEIGGIFQTVGMTECLIVY